MTKQGQASALSRSERELKRRRGRRRNPVLHGRLHKKKSADEVVTAKAGIEPASRNALGMFSANAASGTRDPIRADYTRWCSASFARPPVD